MCCKSNLEREMEILKNHRMVFNLKIVIQTILLIIGISLIITKSL